MGRALTLDFSPQSVEGVAGGVGSLRMGESGGGGMLVPSVMLPKLRSRAGSSNRLAEVCDDDMTDLWEG